MDGEPEVVVRDQEAAPARLQDEVLVERLRGIVVRLELPEDVDEDAAVLHGLAVHRRDEVGDLLEGQRRDLLHDLGRALQTRNIALSFSLSHDTLIIMYMFQPISGL